jgi:tight adherence protein C
MTVADYLPFGITPDDIIAFLAGIVAFVSVYAVWNGLIAKDPLSGRLKTLNARRSELKAEMLSTRRRNKDKDTKSVDFMRQVVGKLKLLGSAQSTKIEKSLAQAGIRSRDGVVIFLFFKVVLPIVLATIAVVLFYGLQLYDLPPMARLAISLMSVLLGFYAPDLYVRNLGSKRQHMLRKGLPDALDLMVICAEAGLTLDASLNRVARELGTSWPELGEEFGLTAIELGFLPDRRRALHNLIDRTGLPGIRGMVNTLLQSEKYGTPLAQSLRVLASEFRDERMMRAEEKAARLPATMTVPLVIFVLPALFVVLIGPAIIGTIDNLSKL